MLGSVLVANRGEIAVRVLRTCRRMGIRGIAVHSEADAGAPFVRAADEAVPIGPAAASVSYLDVDRIVEAALATGADAVHPGYGFLSENPALPRALAAAGVGWVGPSPDVIALMADKAVAKRRMADAGVPVVPGVDDPSLTDDELLERLDEVGYPVLLKAVAGGGGKGMRAVHRRDEAAAALAAAKREARNAFGDDRMIAERLVADPRHVEVQVLGDTHGTVIHVLERDCSVQRRHQKVVEEAPASHLRGDVRDRLHAAAVTAAEAVGYVGAGTVEFLLDGDGEHVFFIEMNTRLQVEHPVTEAITGIDLVEQQLRIAAGEPLGVTQADVTADGHAVEVRLYAEDPAVGFLPQTGTLTRFPATAEVEAADGLRLDTGVAAGDVVSPHYDPMLAKVIAHGSDRPTALERLRATLRSTAVLGVATNIEWLGDLLGDPAVVADEVTTAWLDQWDWQPRPVAAGLLAAAAASTLGEPVAAAPGTPPGAALAGFRPGASGAVVRLAGADDTDHRIEVARAGGSVRATVVTDLVAGTGQRFVVGRGRAQAVVDVRPVTEDGDTTDEAGSTPVTTVATGDRVWVHAADHGQTRVFQVLPATRHRDLGAAGGAASLTSPMPGSIVTVEVAVGDEVEEGRLLLVVEAMKMEHPITAPVAGTVTGLPLAPGDAVEAGETLVTVEPHGDRDDA